MVYRKGITEKFKVLAYVLRENGYSYSEIAKKCKISRTSAIRFSCGQTNSAANSSQNDCKGRQGRPKKLSERQKRHYIRSIDNLRRKDPNFTIKKLVEFSGMDFQNCSYSTYRRVLHEEKYAYRQTRKKGILNEADKRKRLVFARKCKNILKDDDVFFKESITMYLDGVSFVFKTNPMGEAMRPKARVWRKPSEGLDVTTKGSKDLAGGKRLHLMVGISYNKGVVLAVPYEHMSGEYFAAFVYNDLHKCFENMGLQNSYKFIMDNDPSQSSKISMDALDDIGAEIFTIPPRSPDINVIENFFHVVKQKLQQDAIAKNITKETFDLFQERVLNTIHTIDIAYINSLIDSFPKRIEAIIQRKGARSKY